MAPRSDGPFPYLRGAMRLSGALAPVHWPSRLPDPDTGCPPGPSMWDVQPRPKLPPEKLDGDLPEPPRRVAQSVSKEPSGKLDGPVETATS